LKHPHTPAQACPATAKIKNSAVSRFSISQEKYELSLLVCQEALDATDRRKTPESFENKALYLPSRMKLAIHSVRTVIKQNR
jgi:hypothetical protein